MIPKLISKSSSNLPDTFLESYNNLNDLLKNYTDDVIGKIIKLVQESLYNRLIYTATATSRLCAYDERTYGFYTQLMQYYRDILFVYGKNEKSIITEPLKSILGGVISILDARVMADFQHYAENPVLLEKQYIAKECAENFKNDFQELAEKHLEVNAIPFTAFADPSDSSLVIIEVSGILLDLKEKLLEPLYKLYEDHLKSAISLLDNLERRVVALHFFETLKKEYEILNAIITVQIAAIEDKAMYSSCDSVESAVVFNILTYLREVYQHFSKEISEIGHCFEGEYQIVEKEFSIEEFSEFIASFAIGDKTINTTEYESACKEILEAVEAYNNEFELMLKHRLSKELKPFGIGHANYQINKIIAENKTIATELVISFKEIISFYNENEELLADNDNFAIIEGIYSTISIKLQSIEENLEIFNASMLELQEGSKDKIQPLSKAELKEFRDIDQTITEDNNLDVTSILESEAFEISLNKRKNAFQEIIESATKKSIQYKRDYLLFEITTYEEIMNYSVSRLKENGDSIALKFVSICEGVQNEISILLKRNNIDTIAPLPHEVFNGKEHEVLMAEKSDEFKKGEIIKVMNSGFKCGDLVLMRANVIAAR